MRLVVLAFAGVLAGWSAVSADQAPGALAPAGNPQAGRQLFQEYVCYYCHGSEGQGSRPAFGPRIARTSRSFASFSRYVRHPSGRMSAYSEASIPEAALVDIYAFLRAQPEPAEAATLPLLDRLRRR